MSPSSFFARTLLTISASLTAFCGASVLPVTEGPLSTTSSASLASRATSAPPYWVIYSDKWVSGENGPPSVSDITGYNVFALSFWLVSGPADQALEWTLISASDRSSIKASYTAASIKLIVSAFGSTDTPTSSGADPTTTANNLAAWVIEYGLDGVDIDYEDFSAMNAQNGGAETWLATFTTALRAQLPEGQYILTHARKSGGDPSCYVLDRCRTPTQRRFSPIYTSGAYLKVDQTVGSLIDWVCTKQISLEKLVDFYNPEGTSEYTTCAGLLQTSSSTWPNTALFEIAAAGVPLNKLVIGKPATTSDASNGYVDPSMLSGCLRTAKDQGWSAGVMVWQFPDAAASWIQTVRSAAFPE
ncbi:hypothetical protein ID866_2631 [Astraeus odoratus]|nr:hypothetical protein ID866_2631 [Astraeus odoratus]